MDVENVANVSQKYIVHKIGSAPLENGLESKTNLIAQNSSHLCLKNRVTDFFHMAWFVFCTRLNFEVWKKHPFSFFNGSNFRMNAKNKIRRHGFFRPDEIKTLRCQDNYLRFDRGKAQITL